MSAQIANMNCPTQRLSIKATHHSFSPTSRFALGIEKPVCAYRVNCHFSLLPQQPAGQWQATGALPGQVPSETRCR